jgi:uncharacterized protein (DUF169 family)
MAAIKIPGGAFMDMKTVAAAFDQYIRPQTFPLAIRLCETAAELPEKTRLPPRDLGLTVSLCHAIAMSRRYGWTIAVDKTSSCYVPLISLGFTEIPPDVADGSFQARLGLWGMSQEKAKNAINNFPKLATGKYQYVLMAPVDKATFEPHLFLLYAMPAQIWILLSGYINGNGKSGLDVRLNTGAGCTSYITRTMLTGEAQFAMVGTGERLVPHPQDYECAMSIPADKMMNTISGMEKNYRTGVFRYPIPSFMRYDSQHPPGYEQMRSHLLGEDK